jgi:putative DNA primase/helicase
MGGVENQGGLPPEQAAEIRAAAEAERVAAQKKDQPGDSSGGNGSAPGKPKQIDFKQLAQDLHDNYQGDARRYIERFDGKLLFDNSDEQWYRHNCTRWIPDKRRDHLRAVSALAPDYEHQAGYWYKQAAEAKGQKTPKSDVKQLEARAKKYASRAERLKDPSHMKKVLTLAGSGKSSLGISGDEWNKYPSLFACKNCVLDLETGKARDADPGLLINQASPIEWRGLNQEAGEWESFLRQIFLGDDELIDYIQTCVGYWLTGLTTIQEFWTLFGPMGRNGKGVFFRTLRAVMGDYYASIPSAMLTESKMTQGGGPNPELVRLRFTRLAVASEAPKRARISEDALKTYTGGDPVSCRSMYSNTILEFIPILKILFAFNRIPQMDGADAAFRARLNVIPFKAHFTADKSKWSDEDHIYRLDPLLEHRMHTPDILSQILSWAVRGAVRFFAHGAPAKPGAVAAETDEAMDEMDPVGEFIKQALIITRGEDKYSRTQAAPIYDSFVKWCKEEKRLSDKYIRSMTVFGADFKNRPEIKIVPPKNIRTYNVTIKPEWVAEDLAEQHPNPLTL